MNLVTAFNNWRAEYTAHKNTRALVSAFYAADPVSNERRIILQDLIAAENARADHAKQIDLRSIPERTARITAEFQKPADVSTALSSMHDRDQERRQMMDVFVIRKDIKGAARAVVQDRIETIQLQEMARTGFIPRSWSGGEKRREARTARLMQEALTVPAR